MKTNTDYNDEKKYRNYPFWDEDGEISPSQLTDFLEDNGFSQYFSSNEEGGSRQSCFTEVARQVGKDR